MKAKLLLLTATLFIVSCNQKPKEQVETHYSNVQTEAEIRAKSVKDSLEKNKIDSLALIAWGDVKFGISMKQALATETFKNGSRYSNEINMNFERENKFEKALGLKSMYSFSALFEKNELTKIKIESLSKSANGISELLRDCNIFIDNFKAKYGEPAYIKDKVNLSEFDNANKIEYAKFQIGAKKITFLLEWNLYSYKYHYYIYIENDQFPKKKHVQTEQEKKQQKKYVEELKEIKNNSF